MTDNEIEKLIAGQLYAHALNTYGGMEEEKVRVEIAEECLKSAEVFMRTARRVLANRKPARVSDGPH